MDSATTSSGGSSEHKSFSQISRDRLLFEMLGGTKSGWKVLITDKIALKVLSHSCKMSDITDQEVSLVDDILKRREPLPSMDVVYFIQPTKVNVSIITCELSGNEPLYRNAYIFFSSIVPQEIIHQIQGIQGALSRISAVKAVDISYNASRRHTRSGQVGTRKSPQDGSWTRGSTRTGIAGCGGKRGTMSRVNSGARASTTRKKGTGSRRSSKADPVESSLTDVI